jgi:hypothetical protein
MAILNTASRSPTTATSSSTTALDPDCVIEEALFLRIFRSASGRWS